MALSLILLCVVLGISRSGYYNGTTLNNSGTNGNYWSTDFNNSSNANYLNFNSSSKNMNNNNRNYGQSIRAVSTHRFEFILWDINLLKKLY